MISFFKDWMLISSPLSFNDSIPYDKLFLYSFGGGNIGN
jgi:hypothetical protein